MTVSMRTAFPTVNIAFSSSRSAALIERKMLQNTTLSKKFYHFTLSEVKIPVFTLSDVLALVWIHCADQKQHSNRDVLTKSIENTLQTCVGTAKEYMQAYNIGAGVKKHLLCRLHQCKCAGYTGFLFAFVLSYNFFELKISFSTKH